MGEPRTRQALLDAIRDETREAVIEGDRNDCTSPDCVADAVYEVVRVELLREDEARSTAREGLREALLRYGRHTNWCGYKAPLDQTWIGGCTCGFAAALSSPPDHVLSEGLDVERLAGDLAAFLDVVPIQDFAIIQKAHDAVTEYAALSSPAQEQGAETPGLDIEPADDRTAARDLPGSY